MKRFLSIALVVCLALGIMSVAASASPLTVVDEPLVISDNAVYVHVQNATPNGAVLVFLGLSDATTSAIPYGICPGEMLDMTYIIGLGYYVPNPRLPDQPTGDIFVAVPLSWISNYFVFAQAVDLTTCEVSNMVHVPILSQ